MWYLHELAVCTMIISPERCITFLSLCHLLMWINHWWLWNVTCWCSDNVFVCVVAQLKHVKAFTAVTIAIISHKSTDKMSALHISPVCSPINISFSFSEVPLLLYFCYISWLSHLNCHTLSNRFPTQPVISPMFIVKHWAVNKAIWHIILWQLHHEREGTQYICVHEAEELFLPM